MPHVQRHPLVAPIDRRILAWLLAIAALALAASVALSAPDRAQALARLAQCANSLDDDGDGTIDFPAEPGCSSALDPTEADDSMRPTCSDGVDNDNDGIVDFPKEPGCRSASDKSEKEPARRPQCADGKDNDRDGKVDYPQDPGCNWAADQELDTACSDGRDNDGDRLADFPRDLGCSDANDTDESNPPECNDGRDNDSDGTLDFDTAIPTQTADPDCNSALDAVEAPSAPGSPPLPSPPARACADGRDNDADGRIDFPADSGCSSAGDDDESDPRPPFLLPASMPRLLTPFPIVRLRGRSDRHGVRITLLTVRAPKASRVSIYCTGRSCPRKRLAITAGSAIVRVRRFEHRLRGGSVLKIYVTKPGYIGKYTRFRIRSGGVPLRADLCASQPGAKPRGCPAL